jgi:hypothetical protein
MENPEKNGAVCERGGGMAAGPSERTWSVVMVEF